MFFYSMKGKLIDGVLVVNCFFFSTFICSFTAVLVRVAHRLAL